MILGYEIHSSERALQYFNFLYFFNIKNNTMVTASDTFDLVMTNNYRFCDPMREIISLKKFFII